MGERMETTTNIFKILGVQNLEMYHNNMLAWLFDSNQKDHPGSIFLRRITSVLDESMYDAVDMEWKSFKVHREYSIKTDEKQGFIDILCVSEEKKCVICFENKIGSSEHSKQLKRYADYIEKEFGEKGYKSLFVYLTPNNSKPSDPRWKSFDYERLTEITKDAIGNCADSKIKGIVNDYYNILYEIFTNAINFKRFISKFNDEILKKKFPELTEAKVTYNNALYTDNSLKQISAADTAGGYSNTNDLCYICLKQEKSQLERGKLACVLTFTNHPKNLEEGSAFRKIFNPTSLDFRWYDAITVEESLGNEGENMSALMVKHNNCYELFNEVAEKLITRMKEEIKTRGL